MQPGAEDKILNRKVPKSKLLECTKLNDSPILSKLFASPISTTKVDDTSKVTPVSSSRRSISGIKKSATKTSEKPGNTIRSMFMKQLERSQSQTETETACDEQNEKTESKVKETESNGDVPNVIMTPGKLHSRLTRRNSMNANEDQQKIPVNQQTVCTPNKNRRRTVFVSSISQTTIQEEPLSNETVVDAIAMEETLKKTVEKECNIEADKTNGLLKTPSKTATKLPDGVDVKRSSSAKEAPIVKSVLKRRTLYTPQAMDETKIAATDQSLNSRRKTLNFSSFSSNNTPKSSLQNDDMVDTASCDASINNKYGKK